MNLLIATNNAGKVQEYRSILSTLFPALTLLTLREVGIEADVEETGQTFEANARLKSEAYGTWSGLPVIADDSGLIVEAFGGDFPGVQSNRWAGPNTTAAERNARLLEHMAELPTEQRSARFVCVAILRLPNGREVVGYGEVQGRIGLEERGASGFGYDPIFLLPELGRTMAELSAQEKNSLSHRGRAARDLAGKAGLLL